MIPSGLLARVVAGEDLAALRGVEAERCQDLLVVLAEARRGDVDVRRVFAEFEAGIDDRHILRDPAARAHAAVV